MRRFLEVSALLCTLAACNKKEAQENAPAGEPPATSASPAEPAKMAEPAQPVAETAEPVAQPTEPAQTAEPKAAPAAGGTVAGVDIDALCTKFISMMEAMATTVSAAKDNCDAMGGALQKWADDHRELIDWSRTHKDDPALEQAFDEKCDGRTKSAMQKLLPQLAGASACHDHPKVKAALAFMQEGKDKDH